MENTGASMTKASILTIDVGTQSTRAAIVAPEGEILGIAQIPHETDSPHSGWAQQRPVRWWSEVCEAIQRVRSRRLRPVVRCTVR